MSAVVRTFVLGALPNPPKSADQKEKPHGTGSREAKRWAQNWKIVFEKSADSSLLLEILVELPVEPVLGELVVVFHVAE